MRCIRSSSRSCKVGHLSCLGGEVKVYGTDDGVVVVEKFTMHEWRRADGEEEGLVVREWTEPSDGQKEVFFRMLNSFLTSRGRRRCIDSWASRCRWERCGLRIGSCLCSCSTFLGNWIIGLFW